MPHYSHTKSYITLFSVINELKGDKIPPKKNNYDDV